MSNLKRKLDGSHTEQNSLEEKGPIPSLKLPLSLSLSGTSPFRLPMIITIIGKPLNSSLLFSGFNVNFMHPAATLKPLSCTRISLSLEMAVTPSKAECHSAANPGN
ncbi:hypothetical protein NPIL_327511 [Nephila pilipes]|uniref:Uncharacterized protein n=1 Tax=Nephila pilipes TaxID=299642 RepID=A0A8X6MSI3_NEPPI|nr:hypothetical protein NPIL_327511 [Nephila pilipes]